MLQFEHRLGVEQVILPLPPPLVLATRLERAVGQHLRAVGKGPLVALGAFGRHLGQPDATELGGETGEELTDKIVPETDGLENLGTGVGGDRRDAHLRHHLDDAVGRRLHVVVKGLVAFHRDVTRVDPSPNRGEGQ